MTEIQHKSNDILFSILKTRITTNLTQRAYNELKECWKELNNLDVNSKAQAKKNELLEKLKQQILKLREISNVNSSTNELQAVLNFNLSIAIKFKNEEHDAHEILSKILSLKQLKSDLGSNYAKLNVAQFEKVVEELKEKLIFFLELR